MVESRIRGTAARTEVKPPELKGCSISRYPNVSHSKTSPGGPRLNDSTTSGFQSAPFRFIHHGAESGTEMGILGLDRGQQLPQSDEAIPMVAPDFETGGAFDKDK